MKKKKPRKPTPFKLNSGRQLRIFIGKKPIDVDHMVNMYYADKNMDLGWLYYDRAIALRDWLNRYIAWAEYKKVKK